MLCSIVRWTLHVPGGCADWRAIAHSQLCAGYQIKKPLRWCQLYRATLHGWGIIRRPCCLFTIQECWWSIHLLLNKVKELISLFSLIYILSKNCWPLRSISDNCAIRVMNAVRYSWVAFEVIHRKKERIKGSASPTLPWSLSFRSVYA